MNLAKAKALNLIHAIVPAADMIKAAKDWIKGGGKAVAPWDEKGFKLPGGPVFSKMGMQMFPAGNAIYRRETYDNYPAARAIMSCVYEGLQLPIDAALRVESRYFTQILRSKEAAAMIRSLFLSMQELNKGAGRPQNLPPSKAKAETYAKAQPLLKSDAIFASNTSTLPITSLAQEFKEQSKFLGIHFFSPVE